MSLPDYKALKKLADACRKAGITHFKNAEFEFTLSDNAPISNYKRKASKEEVVQNTSSNSPFQSDTLTDEQLLYWSLQDPTAEESTQ